LYHVQHRLVYIGDCFSRLGGVYERAPHLPHSNCWALTPAATGPASALGVSGAGSFARWVPLGGTTSAPRSSTCRPRFSCAMKRLRERGLVEGTADYPGYRLTPRGRRLSNHGEAAVD